METRNIPLAALVALSLAGNVYFVYQGTTYRAAIVEPARGPVRLTGGGVANFLTRAQEAGATGNIECKRGVTQRPNGTTIDLVYCSAGTAGFHIGNALALTLLNEVKAKIPGITADEVRLSINEAGELWASRLTEPTTPE